MTGLHPYPGRVRALIVDDEVPALSELGYLVEQDGRVDDVVCVSSATEALKAMETGSFDVIFSDISMPGLDGLALARVIARFSERPQIVFVTAHESYAVEAFDVQAIDYLMKPVRPERLGQAIGRVLQSLPDSPAAAVDDERIAVELAGVTRFVQRSNVRFVQAQGDYARLVTSDGSHLLRVPLSSLENDWSSAGFVRIHRSTLVNLHYVLQVRNAHGQTSLTIGDPVSGTVQIDLPVSRRHAREVRDRVFGRD